MSSGSNINIITSLDNAMKLAISNLADDFADKMNAFALKDTGALRESISIKERTNTSFVLEYYSDHAEFTYHNPEIHNVTTPNTTQYWDDVFLSSRSYDEWIKQFENFVCDNFVL